MAHLTDIQRANQATQRAGRRPFRLVRNYAPSGALVSEYLVPRRGRVAMVPIGRRIRLGKAAKKAAKRARVRERIAAEDAEVKQFLDRAPMERLFIPKMVRTRRNRARELARARS